MNWRPSISARCPKARANAWSKTSRPASACRPVLSPAAYFVDLMYYVEENILKGSFRTAPQHPLHLEKRRPDLWDLSLTCDNTTNFVPYLDLVNEILETYLKQVVPLDAATPVYK